MKPLHKYKTITGRDDLKVGIWDNCGERIETNGRRFRVRYDYVRWVGNSGSLAEKTIYIDREEGRRVLRQYRSIKRDDLRGVYSGACWLSDLVEGRKESNK